MRKNEKTVKRIAEYWDSANIWLKRLITFGASVATIFGVFAGILGWGIDQLDGFIDTKLDDISSQLESVEQGVTTQVDILREESQEADRQSKLSGTRLELNMLIAHNPTNVIEIEKVARYYFLELGGDWYMSQIYSDWAKTYGGDVTFVTDLR